MLSFKPIHVEKASAASRYFAGYYAASDADAVGDTEGAGNGEPPGRFYGTAAEKLGCTGIVSKSDLEACLNGRHPKTGEQLVRQIAKRTRNGKEQKPVAAYDLTFSAPKSVSTIWAAGDAGQRDGIMNAHHKAVQAALDYLRENGMTYSVGHAGSGGAMKGDAFHAWFDHSTSRAGDPQIHTHVVTLNIGIREDGSIQKIRFDTRQIHSAGAVYQSVLAHELQKLGYRLVRVDPKHGFFKIEGIPDELEKGWSKRGAEVKAELAREGKSDAVSASRAALVTRSGKENPDRESNFVRWRSEAAEYGFGPDEIKALPEFRGEPAEPAPEKTDEELIAEAMDKKSVIHDAHLYRIVFADSITRYSPGEAFARVERIRDAMVRLERGEGGRKEVRLTTQAVLDREARIRHNGGALAKSTAHGIESKRVEALIDRVNAELKKNNPKHKLTDDQIAVLRGSTDARGLALVQGHAGTGKTFIMKNVVELYRAKGYDVIGTSLGSNAADILGTEAGIASKTIESLRLQVEGGSVALHSKTLVIVDEAGMAASRDVDFLLSAARGAGAKVLMVGDTKQLSPVEAGRPFADLQSKLGMVELTTVMRQKDPKDAEIGQLVRDGKPEQVQKAVDLMRQRGQWVVGGSRAEARAVAAGEYVERVARGENVFMIASKNKDTEALNQLAREQLKQRGLLGDDVVVTTQAGAKPFAVGDRVMFRANETKVTKTRNGKQGAVEQIDGRRMTVRLDDGRRLVLNFDAEQREAKAREKITTLAPKVAALEAKMEVIKARRENASREPATVRKEIAERTRLTKSLAAAQASLKKAHDAADEGKAHAQVLAKLTHAHAFTEHKSQGATSKQIEKRGGDVICFNTMSYTAVTRPEGRALIVIDKKSEAAVITAASQRKEKESVNDFDPEKRKKEKQEQEHSKPESSNHRGQPNDESARPAPRRAAESQGLSESERAGWEARENAFWEAREATRSQQVREATDRQRARESAAKERDDQLASGVRLTPQERAEAQARGMARVRDREEEIKGMVRVARFVQNASERAGTFGDKALAGAFRVGWGAARLVGGAMGVRVGHIDFRPKPKRDTGPVLTTSFNVDKQSVVQAEETVARRAKEQRLLQDAGREAVQKERFEKEANRAWGDVLGEIRRLKTSADPLDQKRGAKVEAELDRIDELHKAGHNDYAKQARIDLARTCVQLRDAREPELRREDMKNWVQVNDEIAALRRSSDKRDHYKADVAEATLKGSLEARTDSEFVESAVVRRNLATDLREQREERERREKGAAAEKDRGPQADRDSDRPPGEPKPSSDAPKSDKDKDNDRDRKRGPDHDDGHVTQ